MFIKTFMLFLLTISDCHKGFNHKPCCSCGTFNSAEAPFFPQISENLSYINFEKNCNFVWQNTKHFMVFNFLRQFYNMGPKFLSQMGAHFLTRCLPIAFTLNDVCQNVHVFEGQNLFLLKCCCKFNVE